MSVPPQQKLNTDKDVKQRATAVKDPTQHAGDVFYGMGPPALHSTHMDSGGSTAAFNPEKGLHGRVHYQSSAKWMHQDPTQVSGWSQEAPVQTWGQNFGSYIGGINNIRTQMSFPKGGHDGGALQIRGEKQTAESLEVYREAAQAQARGLDWDHANAAIRQAHLQAFQQGHKDVDMQGQPHMPGSMLQPFQMAFGATKQHLPSAYYQVYQGNKGMPNLSYSDPPKTQHQMLQLQHQIQQQQQQQQKQQQQNLHQQQQHQQLQHQIHQQHMQQQHLQQIRQYRQQQIQEQRQQAHQLQQQQEPHNLPQQEIPQPQFQQKQHQNQHFLSYQSTESCLSSTSPLHQKENAQLLDTQGQAGETETQVRASSVPCDQVTQKVSPLSAEPSDAPQVLPRRSRRLSRDGLSPLGGPPIMAPWTQASSELLAPQNGQVAGGVEGVNAGDAQAAPGGVIQSTRRRRRASKEINLETLAQKASEMESLPAKMAKQKEGAHGRQPGMMPLVIPVSVPVGQADPLVSWHHGCLSQQDQSALQPEHKPSVIVARRRSLRSSLSDSCGQDAGSDAGQDDDGKLSRSKRRPRPEPLFIPPPKAVTFIAPSVYSSITPYQSHLRSPVRILEPPLVLPPYTPPPILSPVRDGSGLYFSTFLSSIAAGNQSLPPPATPKSSSRSLLRSCSSDITPPVLPLITDPTPVSFEPRINIGVQYQAEVPELCERCLPLMEQPKADLLWVPIDSLHTGHVQQHRVDDLMNLACSSVFHGGGTNQELALHCLHACGGDVLEALTLLLFKQPVFSQGHHLADYHYSGSDSWTLAEKHYFNKGISAYRKDFFMVQKLVQTKSVAQCVEFYYTYKKQVKIGRNGGLTFGPPESPAEKITEATVDVKSSQYSMLTHQDGDSRKWEGSCDQSQDGTVVSNTLQTHDNTGMVVVLKERGVVNCKPRPESAGKKRRPPPKPPLEPEGVFPCKKCTRVFYKVKSRSAHMKSHADQEKKAAAQRLKEQEAKGREAELREAELREAELREAELREAAEEEHTSSGVTEAERPEASSREESSEVEDENDEDWN